MPASPLKSQPGSIPTKPSLRLNGRSAIMRCPEMPHRLAGPLVRGSAAACGGYIDRAPEACQQTFAKKCSDPTSSSRRSARHPEIAAFRGETPVPGRKMSKQEAGLPSALARSACEIAWPSTETTGAIVAGCSRKATAGTRKATIDQAMRRGKAGELPPPAPWRLSLSGPAPRHSPPPPPPPAP